MSISSSHPKEKLIDLSSDFEPVVIDQLDNALQSLDRGGRDKGGDNTLSKDCKMPRERNDRKEVQYKRDEGEEDDDWPVNDADHEDKELEGEQQDQSEEGAEEEEEEDESEMYQSDDSDNDTHAFTLPRRFQSMVCVCVCVCVCVFGGRGGCKGFW